MEISQERSRLILSDGEILPYKVERRGVKHPRLELTTEELLVILPKRWRDETSLLEEKRDWIYKNHARIKGTIDDMKCRLGGTESLPILGDFFNVRKSNSLVIDYGGKMIECDLDDPYQLRRLGTALKQVLIQEIRKAADFYSKKFDVNFKKISVKKQRSKWGSCSFRGNINFNIRLVLLPKDLVWYLVCHEVAHLREKSHKKTFWKLVGSEFKNYKEMEKKLFDYWLFARECYRSTFTYGKVIF